jgi:hypothetical protein
MTDQSYQNYLSQLEQQNGLPNGLLAAQMNAESGGDPSAVSPKGALGAFQFMPATAQQYGIDPTDPMQAAQGAAQMNADLLKKYGGDLPSALAAYNWGQGNVDRQGLSNAPPETQNYISKIMSSLGSAIVPSAQAAETHDDVPPGFVSEDSYISQSPKAQIAADVSGESQIDPSGMNAQPWSALHIQSQPLDAAKGSAEESDVPPGFVSEDKLNNALGAVTNPDTSVMARLTGYGANAISEIPGLKEAGSALAALAGYGKGDDFSSRYSDLEDSQKVMRQMGKQFDPGATALGKISATIGGIGLGNKLYGSTLSALPEGATSALAAFSAEHPVLSTLASNGLVGGLYGASDGESAKDRLASALTGAAWGSGAGGLISLAANKFAPAAMGKLAETLASGSGDSVAAQTEQSVAPLETDLSKIDLNTPIKQYENIAPALDVAIDPTIQSKVNELSSINSQISKLQSVGSTDAAGVAQLGELNTRADVLRQELVGRPVEAGAPAPIPTSEPIPVTPPAIGTKGGPKTSADMQILANGAYANAKANGGILSPDIVNKFVDAAEKVTPQTAAGRLVSGDSETTKLVQRLQALRGKPLSLDEAQEIDEEIGNLASSNTDLGKFTKEGLNINKVQSALRDTIDGASESDVVGGKDGFNSLVQARKYWSQMLKMRDVERIINRATNGKDNPGIIMKNGFGTLAAKLANASRGWTPQEISAVQAASKTGAGASLARVFGSRLIPIAAAVVGETTGGPIGAVIGGGLSHIASSGARKIVTNSASARAQNVLQTIAKNTTSKVRK